MFISRRNFIQKSTVTTAFLGLGRYANAQVAPPDIQAYDNQVEAYGPLVRDPKQIMDLPSGPRHH